MADIYKLSKYIIIILFTLDSIFASAAPTALTYQGRIIKSDGTALEYSNVSFLFQILNPSGSCLVYQEQFNGYNMVNSKGVFDVPIGTGSVQYPTSGGFTILDAFNNSSSFTCGSCSASGAGYSCSAGSGAFNPVASDGRILRVSFYDGQAWQQITPDSVIRTVPFAGFAASALKLGTNTASDFVLKTGIPTCNASEFLTWNGTALACQGISGASGGTVTNVSSGNSYLTVSNPTSTPQLTINVGTTAGTLAAGNDSRIINALQSGGSASGDLSGTWPGPTVAKIQSVGVSATTPTSGQYFKFDGTNWGPATIAMSDVNNLSSTLSNYMTTSAFNSAVSPAGSCSTSQSMYWNSVSGAFACQNIDLPGVALLAGRSGGQTLNGGTAASENLVLDSTANATKGTISLAPSGGNVGVGTSTPGATFDIAASTTATSSQPVASRTVYTWNPASNSSATPLGLDIRLNSSATAVNLTGGFMAAIQAQNNHFGTGIWSGNAKGSGAIVGASTNRSTGTMTHAPGIIARVNNNSTGTITNAYGFVTDFNNITTGTVSNMYGYYATVPVNATGTISNYYGLYIQNPTTATNAYSIYSEGGKNYFAGNIGVGVTNPAVSLDLSSKTDAVYLPKGTTAQQPSTPGAGMLRYNTDNSGVEFYNGSAWMNLSSASGSGAMTNVSSITGGSSGVAINAGGTNQNVTLTASGTGVVTTASPMTVTNATASTSSSTGAVVVSGGLGVGGNINAAGSVNSATSMTVGSNSKNSQTDVIVNAAAGNWRGLQMQTAGSTRWYVNTNNTAESGSNAGSDFAIRRYDDSGNSLQTAFFIKRSNGYTGVATLSPTAQFQVGASSPLKMGNYPTSNNYWMRSYYGMNIGWDGTNWSADTDGSNNGAGMITSDAGGAIRFYTFPTTGNSINSIADTSIENYKRMVLTSAGNLGVGTSTASYKVVASDSDADTRIQVQNLSSTASRYPTISVVNYKGSTSGYPRMILANHGGDSSAISATSSGDILGLIGGWGSYSGAAMSTHTAGISFVAEENFTSTNGGSGIRIATTPIGTITPLTRLSIDASGNTEIGTNSASSSSLRYVPSTNQSSFRITSSASANWIQSGVDYTSNSKKDLYFSSIGGVTTWMAIQGSTGNVGIGTTAPGASLDLSSKTDAIITPRGTTAQRPSTGTTGMIRYNTDTASAEVYLASGWTSLASITSGGTVSQNISVITGGSSGVSIAAGGTNQSVTLTASGTGTVTTGSVMTVTNSTASTAYNNGALVVSGGVGVSGNINSNGNIYSEGVMSAVGGLRVGTATYQGGLFDIHNSKTNTNADYAQWVNHYPLATVNGTYSSSGLNVRAYPTINSGIGNPGGISGAIIQAKRAVFGTDSGTLSSLVGGNLQYGHAVGGATPTTTSITGLKLDPLIGTGTATNLYDIFITAKQTGGTVTNHWAMYQQDSTAKNFFAGAVGIGTTTPGANLHISPAGSSGVQEVMRISDPNTGASEGGYISWESSGKTDQVRLGQISNATGSAFYVSTNAADSGTPTERLRITPAGYLGIGTSAPGRALQVGSSGAWSDTSGILVKGANPGIELTDTQATPQRWLIANGVVTPGDGKLGLAYNVNTAKHSIVVQADGNVGIGTNTPSHPLDIVGVKNAFTGTGTIAVSAGSDEIVGTGTSFTTEFKAGDILYWGSVTNMSGGYIVKSVNSNTSMTVGLKSFNTLSGQTFYGIKALQTISSSDGQNFFSTSTAGQFSHLELSQANKSKISYNATLNSTNTTASIYGGQTVNFADTDGTYYWRSASLGGAAVISSGITNSGDLMGLNLSSARNSAPGDAGTLAVNTGLNAIYGHFNRDSSTPTTNFVYGIKLAPQALTGTIKKQYDIFIGTPTGTPATTITDGTGGNIDHYAVYQESSAATNYFGGNIGVGVAVPSYKLDVSGDINASGSVRAAGVALSSDARFKRNIASITNPLGKVLALRGVEYDWKTDQYPERKFNDRHQIGVIAQEVEKVFPEVVDTDKQGFKSVNYPALVAPVIGAIKELYAKLLGVDTTVQQQSQEIKSLKQENQALKQYLCQKDPAAPFCH